METKSKVLFLCTGNPSRGGIAEGFLRHFANGTFLAASAGIEPEPVSALAIEVMKEVGIDISTQHSKNTKEALKERFAVVISVCDMAKERNPVFPFAFRIFKWSLENPEDASIPAPEQLSHFRRVRDEIEKNVREFLAGPGRELRPAF